MNATVKDVMTAEVVAVRRDTTFKELAVDLAMTMGFPEPARCWLSHAIVPGTPLWESSAAGGRSPLARCWPRPTATSGRPRPGWPACR